MNSADGISESDQTTLLVGSHEHDNWGFSAPGMYQVTFQVIGRRLGESADITSPLTPLTFHVLPLPARDVILRVARVDSKSDLQIEISGNPEVTYSVETSSDLKAWTRLQLVTVTGARFTFTVPAMGAQQFVRARLP